jgi:hypothetical protein
MSDGAFGCHCQEVVIRCHSSLIIGLCKFLIEIYKLSMRHGHTSLRCGTSSNTLSHIPESLCKRGPSNTQQDPGSSLYTSVRHPLVQLKGIDCTVTVYLLRMKSQDLRSDFLGSLCINNHLFMMMIKSSLHYVQYFQTCSHTKSGEQSGYP